VDPCEDFFEFACGNWIANHPIPRDKTRFSVIDVLSGKVQGQMREIFESNEVFASKSMNALKSIYRRCMDKDELNRIGARQMIEKIKSFGTWPMLEGDEKWRVNTFDLTSLLAFVSRNRGVNAFITYIIDVDDKNTSRRLIR
ncbi:unnamed protein product, partial [Strongylus vulgaris]